MELVTNQMPPALGLRGSDLACMLQLSSELNQVGEKKNIHMYIYLCALVFWRLRKCELNKEKREC